MKSDQRIVRQILPSGATYDGIYEVYYDEEGRPTSRATQLSTLLAPTTKALVIGLSDMRRAFDRPILLEVNDEQGRFVEISTQGDMT
jgi:YD repeat-containing protein